MQIPPGSVRALCAKKEDQFFIALAFLEKQSDSRISLTAAVSLPIARFLAASNRYVSSADPRAIHSALRPSRAPWEFKVGLKSGISVSSESETTRSTTAGT